ncbi:MAG: magnesium chelatase, partial [Sphingomonas sp.]|nr:magnesium chelatase [Sphingomonas sp.]
MTTPQPLADAVLAARLCAADPGLGGLVVAGAGPLMPLIEQALVAALPPGAPVKRLPAHIDEERLHGGMDLGATLSAGRPVARAGLLAAADGGAVIVPMAERLGASVAAALAAALDTGMAIAEREGLRLADPARFVVLAEDEGEGVPAPLAERLAFRIDLSGARGEVVLRDLEAGIAVPDSAAAANGPLPAADDGALEALTGAAMALGIDSARAPLFALRAARGAARLAGRARIADEDLALAARLVLAPRATRLPPAEEDAAPPEPPPPPDSTEPGEEQQRPDAVPPQELVVEAALAALPRDLLASLAAGAPMRRAQSQGKGARQRAAQRGR